MAPCASGSRQDPPRAAGAEVAHAAPAEGQWDLGAVAPAPFELRVPVRFFCP